MEERSHEPPVEEECSPAARGWWMVVGIAVSFLAWGFLVFLSVGDKGPPDWDYSIVPDVPGESPYSTRSTGKYLGSTPYSKDQWDLQTQHVMEPQRPFALPGKGEGP